MDVVGGNLVAIVVVLFFVFLTMGALVSVVQEVIAQLVRARSRSLRKCVRQMLADDTYGTRIFDRFYRHPRIATSGKQVRNLTFIDPDDFAIAMATAIQPANSHEDALCALPDSILALQDGKLKQRLRLALPDVFRDGRDPEAIKAAVASWYNAQMNATTQAFRVATRLRLFSVAAVCTVLLNVSPIKVVEYLMAKPEIAQQFSLVIPELADRIYSGSENTLAAFGGSAAPDDPAAGDVADPETPVKKLAGGANSILAGDVQPLLVLFECKRGVNVLPIGWPWMADLAANVDKQAQKLQLSAADGTAAGAQAEACGRALAKSSFSSEAIQRLSLLGIAYTPPEPVAAATPPSPQPDPAAQPDVAAESLSQPSETRAPAADAALPGPQAEQQALLTKAYAEQFQPVYGPDPSRDPLLYVLLGWFITTVAAAQGAPFWFDLLRKLISRK